MLQQLDFIVLGRPQQRGSKTAIPIGKRGGGFLTRANGSPMLAIKDDNEKSKSWMQEVRSAAAAAHGGRPLLMGPIELSIEFHFSRPKHHYRTGRNAHLLKDDAPRSHAQSPDLAKLIRCLEDALTGIVWMDDRQVFRYANMQRVWTSSQEMAIVRITECSE